MSEAIFVVACGAAKLDRPAPARELYCSPTFRHILAAAEAEAEATTRDLGVPSRVLIMSAKHGLVSPDAELEPYNVTLDDPGAISTVALAASMILAGVTEGSEFYAMLPGRYLCRLAAAAPADVMVVDTYEAAPGIGFQRAVASSLLRHTDDDLGA